MIKRYKLKLASILTIAVVMIMGTIVPAYGESSVPVNNEIYITGGITEIDVEDMNDVDYITVSFDIYIDPVAYDFLDAGNIAVVFDETVVSYDNVISTTNNYATAPIPISDKQVNIAFANMNMKPADANGYCTTINISMKVIDAEKLISDGGTTIKLALHNHDLTVYYQGGQITYVNIVEGYVTFDMPITITPMQIVITDKSKTNIEVAVQPSNVEVEKGKSHQFNATITGSTEGVTWSIEGATSSNTMIDQNGLLTVGSDEEATSIIVRATSVEDPTVSATATATITTPVDPTDPVDPSDPADPVDPTDPSDSVDPTNPTNPTDPADSNPSKKPSVIADETSTTTLASVNTGDETNATILYGLLGLSLAGAIIVVRRNLNYNKNEA